MAKILITGATGYIGSFLSQHLSQQGHEVTAAARNPSAELQGTLGCQATLTLDVLAIPSELNGSWDCIIHAATANDIVSRSFSSGVDLSVNGTQQVLELAKRCRVAQVIFFSTLQVYGIELQGDISEQRAPTPENAYGLNHLLGEETCYLASRQHRIVTSVVRPANVYGCPVSSTVNRLSLVPMCFVKEVLKDSCITLRSSGLQKRDFVSLHQVSEACLTLVSQPPTESRAYNISTGSTLSMLEVAQIVREVAEQQLGRVPEIRVLSTEPSIANAFTVQSSIVTKTTLTQSVEEMRQEIAKMFHCFANT